MNRTAAKQKKLMWGEFQLRVEKEWLVVTGGKNEKGFSKQPL